MKNRFLIIPFIIICSFFFNYNLFAQGISPEDFQNEVPNVTPVSPEAGTMFQYANIPVNMSAGQMSFQVPIHTISIPGGYSWPVNLNYRYAGLVLEAQPSLSGLGWMLSGGGSVTRELRGVEDIHPNGIYGSTYTTNFIDEIVAGNTLNLSEVETIERGEADTELDKYNVSIGGVSFSFKIDKVNGNYVPVYLSEHNYKVDFPNPVITDINDLRDGTNNGPNFYDLEFRNFTVTDDQGITYFFDQAEVNEPQSGAGLYSDTSIFGYISAWHISQVTFPNGEVITFSYTDDDIFSSSYSASGYKNIWADTTPPDINQQGTCAQLVNDINFYSQSHSSTLIRRKLLTGITFPNGSISMNTAIIDTRDVYNQIIVSNDIDQTSITYDLTHIGNRDVLTKVQKNGNNYYEFEYNNQSNLPAFHNGESNFPHQQDYWGFYNGSANLHMLNIPNTNSYNADKRPNFFAAKKGAMSKIIYPTGGYSTIRYESNQIKKPYSQVDNNTYAFNRKIHLKLETDNDISAPSTKSVTFDYTFTNAVIARISHKTESFGSSSWITTSITPTSCSATTPYYTLAQQLRSPANPIPTICPLLTHEFDPGGQGGMPNNEYPLVNLENSGGDIMISPGTYTFSIVANRNNLPAPDNKAKSEIIIDFHEPEDTSNDPYVNANIGGIRVKDVYHVAYDGIATKQNYNYNDSEGLSTGVELSTPNTSTVMDVLADCNFEGTGNVQSPYRYEYQRINYLARSFNPITLNSGVPIYYTKVKQFSKSESIDDNGNIPIGNYDYPLDKNPDGSLIFSVLNIDGGSSGSIQRYINGYTETHFDLPSFNFTQLDYPFTPKGSDLNMGRVGLTKTYAYDENESTSYRLKQEQSVLYGEKNVDPIIENHPYSVKVARKKMYINLETSVAELNNCLEDKPHLDGCNNHIYFQMNEYRDVDVNSVNTESTSTSLLSNGTQVTSTNQSTYDSFFNIKTTETENSHGDVIKSTMYYPYDLLNPNTAPNHATHQSMVDNDQINKVIKIENYKNDILLTTRKNNYDNVNGDYKQANIETQKGTSGSLDSRIIFTYFGNGNLKETYTSEDYQGSGINGGIVNNPVTYIWGYNKQYPIAKIENATHADVSAFIGNLQSLSNLDNDRTLYYSGNEGALRQALDSLRNEASLSSALITTYTYDSLIGVTSITDPRGITIYYEYDTQYRLKHVKDKDGNILNTNEYNYINQN